MNIGINLSITGTIVLNPPSAPSGPQELNGDVDMNGTGWDTNFGWNFGTNPGEATSNASGEAMLERAVSVPATGDYAFELIIPANPGFLTITLGQGPATNMTPNGNESGTITGTVALTAGSTTLSVQEFGGAIARVSKISITGPV